MLRKLGSHPDNPNPARTMEEAFDFSSEQTVCSKCGKQGGHSVEGMAMLARKTVEGRNEILEVHCVKCGRCGSSMPVFHRACDHFVEIGNRVTDHMCQPGGGFQMLMATGLPPQAWLPADILAQKTVP